MEASLPAPRGRCRENDRNANVDAAYTLRPRSDEDEDPDERDELDELLDPLEDDELDDRDELDELDELEDELLDDDELDEDELDEDELEEDDVEMPTCVGPAGLSSQPVSVPIAVRPAPDRNMRNSRRSLSLLSITPRPRNKG